MPQANLGELAAFLSRSIVSNPDGVSVEEQADGGNAVVVKVRVSAPDVGRLIGRKGRTIDAIRTIIDAAASADGRQATVDVVEPDADVD